LTMIQTKRHLLVDIEKADIENIHSGLSDQEVTRYYGVHFNTLEETKKQMKWYRDLVENGQGHWWKIIRIRTGHFVGAVGFNDWDHLEKTAEVGIWIIPQFQGTGRMGEILEKVIEYGFDRMSLESIHALVESENEACKTAINKTPMEFVETQKDAEIKNGKSIDIDRYEIQKPL
jgi:[ribosomal protein S5]-alanine N-acetyltransferase